MISVGCDFGLRKSGIVLLDENYEILSQNLLRVNSTVKGAERLVDIENGFHTIVKDFRNEDLTIFVEGYAYGAKYQRESLAELGGVIRRYLYLHNLTFLVIPPNSLKLFVTGTGRAKKNFMKKCTKDKWGQSFKSDDVCDAYGLSRLGMTTMKIQNGAADYSHLDNHERLVVEDIVKNPELYRNKNTASKVKKKSNVKARKRKTKS